VASEEWQVTNEITVGRSFFFRNKGTVCDIYIQYTVIHSDDFWISSDNPYGFDI